MVLNLRVSTKYCAFLFFISVLSAENNSTQVVNSREEIHVMRSVRTSRTAPTDYCADSRTGFSNILFEDRYLLYAVNTGPDGAIVVPLGAQTAVRDTLARENCRSEHNEFLR